MLVESLLLAAAGTVAGAAAALALIKIGMASLPVTIPRMENAGLDLRLLAFAAVVTAATAILFGLVPAMIVSRTRASEALKESGRSATSARSRNWNRVLVVAEVALASMALVASALLVRSVTRMMHAPVGIQADHVVTTSVQMTGAASRDWPRVQQFYAAFLDAARQQPGVQAAGVTNAMPLEVGWRIPFGVEGRVPASHDEQNMAQIISVSDGYFEAMGVKLVAGRFFDARDNSTGEPAMVINETLARKYFAGTDPLIHRILSTAQGIGPLGRNLMGRVPHRVIGVVADVQQSPIGRESEPVIYHSSRQFPFAAMSVALRGPDAGALTSAARNAIRQTNPSIALGDVRTMEERLLKAAAEPRLLMFVLTAFAALTALLAAVGVYGLLAWVVNERRRELAIRLALGAKPSGLARLVTMQGVILSVIGVAIGLAGAQAFGGVLQDVLFQTRTYDPSAIASAGVLLIAAALVACLAPALRAARVEPVEGMRE
jgi:putative ABC transport system permease protein